MKPWEEGWCADDDGSVYTLAGSNRMTFLEAVSSGSIDRARLAAAAPELVRQLLALEWGGCHSIAMCPQCASLQRDGHHATCELDAALRKAGVR